MYFADCSFHLSSRTQGLPSFDVVWPTDVRLTFPIERSLCGQKAQRHINICWQTKLLWIQSLAKPPTLCWHSWKSTKKMHDVVRNIIQVRLTFVCRACERCPAYSLHLGFFIGLLAAFLYANEPASGVEEEREKTFIDWHTRQSLRV